MTGDEAGRNGHRRGHGRTEIGLPELGVGEANGVERAVALHMGLEERQAVVCTGFGLLEVAEAQVRGEGE
ncbi:hypothetical protein JCM4914_48390 [Streptomyces platensis subsp. malvinus]